MTIILFAGLLIPFVLITDIFPFLRFGMFAEPIRQEVQTERFLVYQFEGSDKKVLLNPSSLGINPNTFAFLCRNYIYRKEEQEFSKKIFSLSSSNVTQLEISRIISNTETLDSDTTLVGIFQRNE